MAELLVAGTGRKLLLGSFLRALGSGDIYILSPFNGGGHNGDKVTLHLDDPRRKVKNSEGETWFKVEDGWIYSGHLGFGDPSWGKMTRLKIDCPVDVILYDSAGNRIAAVFDDGTLECTDAARVIPYLVGETKFFDILDGGEYRLEIKALAYGAMDYTVYSGYDAQLGEFTEKQEFARIELLPEKKYTSMTGGEIRTTDVQLEVTDEGRDILKELLKGDSDYAAPETSQEPEMASGTYTGRPADSKDVRNSAGWLWIILGTTAALIGAVSLILVLIAKKENRGT